MPHVDEFALLRERAVRSPSSPVRSRYVSSPALVLPGPVRITTRPVRAFKRALDVGAVSLLGVLLLPAMGVIALWIRLDSPGPVLFTQRRPGRGGRTFRIVKFRTMHCSHGPLSGNHQVEFRTYGKVQQDPRVTRCGRWLRRYSLDELPQLWNVLTGTMSLVGPRAYLEEQVADIPNPELVFRVKPGLTGLWQVSGRSLLPFEQRIALDTYYVQRWSPLLDLRILGRTVGAVLRGDGAY